jgi:ATP-dependent DNA helicase RecG
VLDLCWHLPINVIDRRYSPKIGEAEPGRVATLLVRVCEHRPGASRRQPYKVVCEDETGRVELIFFHARPDYLERILPTGKEVAVSGRFELFNHQAQMTHPDHVVKPDEVGQLLRLEPIYPLTAGLPQKTVTKAIRMALRHVPVLPEWLDPVFVQKRNWPSWSDALLQAHNPENSSDVEPGSRARQRLAYDELLANQLALLIVRKAARRTPGKSLKGDGSLRSSVKEALPFSLTRSQAEAVMEIERDLAKPSRMLRLLQGDVGSGKTVVALLAMLIAVEAGQQAALMAPTEILARQHYETLRPLTAHLGIEVVLLTGKDKAKDRRQTLEAIASGRAAIAVGTHALFQDGVDFSKLAVAVIDEQHRFGVHQRLMLAGKGKDVDVLVMTATPIPRTLMLTAYGDMDTSRLLEKPAGRKPVDTRTLDIERLSEVVDGLRRAVESGAQAYWVCPLVEESETSDLAAVDQRYETLRKVFGDRVGLVHGRMKSAEKDSIMADFKAGSLAVLVATTVIEVGVDVPNATVMVIEHAERFGLSQLHQMRGRVGRGGDQSVCLLLYQKPLGETAHRRLEIMRETEDGFVISEEDLRLRGAGEVLGTRQSGMPSFRVADLTQHDDLLAIARSDAKLIVENDSWMDSKRGAALRTLLYLFERDAAVRYIRSG